MRLRILLGTLLMVTGLAIYAVAVAVAVVSARLLPTNTMLQFLFYAAAGAAWIFPAARLTRWMQRAAPFHPPTGASS